MKHETFWWRDSFGAVGFAMAAEISINFHRFWGAYDIASPSSYEAHKLQELVEAMPWILEDQT